MGVTKHGRYRDVLRNRDMRLLLSAFLVDEIGSWAYNIVLIVWVYDQTGSPGWIVAATATGWIPRLLVSTYAGAVADRYERGAVMIGSALSTFLAMLAITLAIVADLPVAAVLAVAVVAAACSSFNRPAANGMLPDVVPEKQLVAANALFATLENVVVVVGPALGGLLLVAGGGPVPGLTFNALTFLVAAILLAQLRTRSHGGAGADGESLAEQVKTGLRALRGQPVALTLVLFCALDSAVYGASTVLYVPLSISVGTGSEGFSYLIAAMAAGGVVAAGLATRLSATSRLAPVIVGGMLVLALPFAAVVLVDDPVSVSVLMVVAGAGMVVVDVLAITALQRDLPREVLSRVFGVFDAAVLVGILLASVLTSVLLTVFGLRTALLVVGLGIPLLTIAGMRPLLRADAANRARVAALQPKVTLLQALDLFSAADPSTLQRLAGALEEVTVPAGRVVLRQGEAAEALFVLVEGELTVAARDRAGRTRRLRTVGPRSYVGEIGLLHGVPRTATVRAAEPCVLWKLSAADFSTALEATAPSASMLRTIGARMARSAARGTAVPEISVQRGADEQVPTPRS